MWKSLSRQWTSKESTEWNGFLTKAEIWIIKAEECWATSINLKMENKISGFIEKQIKRVIGIEKSYGQSKKINDW